jgi:hypothetical protein
LSFGQRRTPSTPIIGIHKIKLNNEPATGISLEKLLYN